MDHATPAGARRLPVRRRAGLGATDPETAALMAKFAAQEAGARSCTAAGGTFDYATLTCTSKAGVQTVTPIQPPPAPMRPSLLGQDLRNVVLQRLATPIRGYPLWQWVALGGGAAVALGLAARLTRLMLVGGVAVGGVAGAYFLATEAHRRKYLSLGRCR